MGFSTGEAVGAGREMIERLAAKSLDAEGIAEAEELLAEIHAEAMEIDGEIAMRGRDDDDWWRSASRAVSVRRAWGVRLKAAIKIAKSRLRERRLTEWRGVMIPEPGTPAFVWELRLAILRVVEYDELDVESRALCDAAEAYARRAGVK